MIPMNEESAITYAVELAKILCQASGSKYSFDKASADGLADFIETLEHRFTSDLTETKE